MIVICHLLVSKTGHNPLYVYWIMKRLELLQDKVIHINFNQNDLQNVCLDLDIFKTIRSITLTVCDRREMTEDSIVTKRLCTHNNWEVHELGEWCLKIDEIYNIIILYLCGLHNLIVAITGMKNVISNYAGSNSYR